METPHLTDAPLLSGGDDQTPRPKPDLFLPEVPIVPEADPIDRFREFLEAHEPMLTPEVFIMDEGFNPDKSLKTSFPISKEEKEEKKQDQKKAPDVRAAADDEDHACPAER